MGSLFSRAMGSLYSRAMGSLFSRAMGSRFWTSLESSLPFSRSLRGNSRRTKSWRGRGLGGLSVVEDWLVGCGVSFSAALAASGCGGCGALSGIAGAAVAASGSATCRTFFVGISAAAVSTAGASFSVLSEGAMPVVFFKIPRIKSGLRMYRALSTFKAIAISLSSGSFLEASSDSENI